MIATFAEIKGNKIGDIPATDVYLDILFKGVGNSASGQDEQTCTGGGGPTQKINGADQGGAPVDKPCYTSAPSAKNACEKADGVIRGKGPFCVDDEEQAALDITECYYVEGLKCIKAYGRTTQGSASGGGAGGCCLMYQNALEATCDQKFRDDCAAQAANVKTDCDAIGGTAPGCEGTTSKPMDTAARAKCTQNFCQSAASAALQSCMEAPFKPVAKCYQKAKDEFDSCQKKIDNKCDCKNCIWQVVDPCADCPNTPDDGAPGADVPVSPTDPFQLSLFKTNSQFGIIPRVFGRYVVSGNVIWVGNKDDRLLTYTLDLDNGDSADVTDVVSTVDILLGIDIGPTQNLMRVWAGEMLIYNKTIDLTDGSTNSGITDLDLSVLAASGYSMARLKAFHPTIEFFVGDAAQNVIETYTNDVGFGLAPAHRGLTLVLFRDVDIALFGNAFPDFRFDVMTTFSQDVIPNVVSATQTDMVTDYMEIDTRTEIVHVNRGDVTTLLNANSLETDYAATTTDATAQIVTKSGHILFYDGTHLRLTDPYRDRLLVDYGTGLGSIAVGEDTMIGLDSTFSSYDALFHSASNGAVTVLAFDYTQDVGATLPITFPSVASKTLHDSMVTGESNIAYLYQFFITSATNAIHIRRITLTDNAVLTDDLAITNYVVDPTLFNSVSDLEYLRVVRDTSDNTFVVFVKSTASGNYVFKLNLVGVAQWNSTFDHTMPVWSRVGEIRSRLATDFYYLIGGDSNVYRITMSDGTVFATGISLAGRGLPTLGGAQFFEGANDSIIYQTADSKVARIYLNRIVPTQVSFADVMRGLLTETRFDPALIDLTDVEDITFDGYLIDAKVTINDVMGNLGKLYQVAFSDDGNKITVLKDSSLLSDPQSRDYYVDNTLHTSRSITAENLDTATCTFVNITDVGLLPLKQTVTIKPDIESTEVPTDVALDLKLNDSAANIRVALEAILRTDITNRDTIELSLFPRDIAFCPRDGFIFNNVLYRITETTINSTDEIRIKGARYDLQVLEPVDLPAVELDNQRLIKRPQRKLPYRPVLLFTNAINEDDVQIAQQIGKQVVYTGIEAPTQVIEPTTFKYRLLSTSAPLLLSNQGTVVPQIDFVSGKPKINADGSITFEVDALDNGSTYYTTQRHTKAVHSGVVVTPPIQIGPDAGNGSIPWAKTDVGQDLVVKFDFAASITEFVSGLDKYAVLETPTANLLMIGREYLQFDQWSVDVDGLTVTFTRLYRGKQGTESYINTHFAGEKVYLYTADTFKTSICDPRWTQKQQLCSIVLGKVSIAGVTDLAWTKRSDAGSARSWPPVGIKMRDVAADGSGNYILRIRHRSPYKSDFNATGGRLQADTGAYTIMGFRGEMPDLEVFEQRIIRDFDEAAVEADLIFKVDILGYDPANQDPDPMVASTASIHNELYDVTFGSNDPDPALPNYIAIMSLRNDTILGHPTFRRLPRGVYPTDIFRP